MTKEEKIEFLKKRINDEDYLNCSIFDLANKISSNQSSIKVLGSKSDCLGKKCDFCEKLYECANLTTKSRKCAIKR